MRDIAHARVLASDSAVTDQGPLPDPLIPADCYMPGMPWLKLDMGRLHTSDLMRHDTRENRGFFLEALDHAWLGNPTGSLPGDDVRLARLFGFGASVRRWREARQRGALRNWILCSDGRLYHPVLSEYVLEAWQSKQKVVARARQASEVRWNNVSSTETSTDASVDRSVEASAEQLTNGKHSNGHMLVGMPQAYRLKEKKKEEDGIGGVLSPELPLPLHVESESFTPPYTVVVASATQRPPDGGNGLEKGAGQRKQPSPSVAAAIEDWNDVCAEAGLPPIDAQAMTAPGLKAIGRTLGQHFREPGSWRGYCERIADSPFLTGDNRDGWNITLAEALVPRFIDKIRNGGFDRRERVIQNPYEGVMNKAQMAVFLAQRQAQEDALETPLLPVGGH